MKVNVESEGPDIRIEIVPLIDVIFCILTFFILAAVGLTRQQAINLDLPKASTGAPQMREMLVVSIDPVGQTYVEKQPLSRGQLYQALLTYNKAKPNGLIVLNASQQVSYNEVIQVLDLLRSVGGDRVALATQPANSPNLSPSLQSPGTLPLPQTNPTIPGSENLLPVPQGSAPNLIPTIPGTPQSSGESAAPSEASPSGSTP